ncbi:MAG: 2Fe-2S iron-sulfur cluster-binding protein [Microthrixaceae bacterium]
MPEPPKPIVVDTPVTLTVDGSAVVAQKGEPLIDACDRAGTHIPRFCYHPRMHAVGMCRMCLVEVDTGRGPALQPSCMLECADGMVVQTETDLVRKVQDGVLEYLLLNHPLDCPVCDKGGECPLQDNTMSFGPGESRWVEEKRHYRKPIPISTTVNLDRERCILCDRCTRFADEVAGDPLIHFMDRGAFTQVNTFPDEPFTSYFSGNTVQICPVGALTAVPYRFKARPWDLEEVTSTCTDCSVGCRITVQSSRNQLLRYNGLDADAVNWSWLCDKGRYGYEAVNSDERLRGPLVRRDDGLVEASWAEALDRTAAIVKEGLDRNGPEGFAVLGGSRLSNESLYVGEARQGSGRVRPLRRATRRRSPRGRRGRDAAGDDRRSLPSGRNGDLDGSRSQGVARSPVPPAPSRGAQRRCDPDRGRTPRDGAVRSRGASADAPSG